MKENKNPINPANGKHEHKLPHEITDEERKVNKAAHEQADEDMDKDAELSAHSPNDDLDEGESARLGAAGEDVVL